MYIKKKNGSHHFRRPLLTPWSHMDYVYDRWRRFFLVLPNLRYHSLQLSSLEEDIFFNITTIVFG